MTARTKLPPYGRAVLDARDVALAQGRALECVRVFYGTDCWQHAKDNAPSLCVPAQEYVPGKYDWAPVAGLPVEMVWLDGDLAQQLAAEIAAVAAPVTIVSGSRQWDVSDFVFVSAPTGQDVWTPEQRADYDQRANLYQRCLAADLGVLELTDDDRRKIAGK